MAGEPPRRSILYEPGAGWGSAEILSTGIAGFKGRPEVAMDATGNAVALWRDVSASGSNAIYASRYVIGTGWQAPEVVDATNGSDETPQLAIDSSGVAIAVWPQGVAGVGGLVRANRFVPGSGWGTSEQINASGFGNAFLPRVAFDASGNALVVWQQLGPALPLEYSVWSNRCTPAGGWSVAEMIGEECPRRSHAGFHCNNRRLELLQQYCQLRSWFTTGALVTRALRASPPA